MMQLNIIRSSRLGPVLFVLLGFVFTYLGFWSPRANRSDFRPEIDSRVEFVIGGFAPFTLACAAMAVYGYVVLWRSHLRSPTTGGMVLLISLFPLVCVSAVAGIYLTRIGIMLCLGLCQLFVSSLMGLAFRLPPYASIPILLILIGVSVGWFW